MNIFGKFLSPLYFGLATSKYAQRKFKKAAKFYKKAIELDSNSKNIEYSYIYLGRCYKETGNYSKALESFSISYELYIKKKPKFTTDFQRTEVQKMLTLYRNMLKGFGQEKRAKEVENGSSTLGIDLDDENDTATSYHILPKRNVDSN